MSILLWAASEYPPEWIKKGIEYIFRYISKLWCNSMFLQALMNQNARLRPTAHDLLKHSIFQRDGNFLPLL